MYSPKGVEKNIERFDFYYGLLEPLGLTLATSKRYIGKVSNGVDFLGYRIGDAQAASMTISKPSIQRLCGRLQQLYEQRAPFGSGEGVSHMLA